MASSNTLKNQIFTLFADNDNKEISAADMRIFVEAIFDNKEELVIKATDEADMKSKRAEIFESSVVLITHSGLESGVYVSRANNPISLLQLDKIADLADGTVTPGSGLSDFMIEYQHNKSYLDADYSYASGNISNIKLKDGVINIYDINFTYTDNNISQTAILEIGGQQVIISYSYTGSNITSKTSWVIVSQYSSLYALRITFFDNSF